MSPRLRRRPLTILRWVFWRLIARYDSETCQDCGRVYRLVWWADSDLWTACTEHGPGGLLCPRCFTARARDRGFLVTWHPHVEHTRGGDGEWQRVPSHIDYERWEERESAVGSQRVVYAWHCDEPGCYPHVNGIAPTPEEAEQAHARHHEMHDRGLMVPIEKLDCGCAAQGARVVVYPSTPGCSIHDLADVEVMDLFPDEVVDTR